MLISLFLLLLAVMAVVVAVQLNRRARLQNLRRFAAATGRTLRLDTCGGIKTNNLYAYLCALASALRTQAMLQDFELRPGELKHAMTDAIESAYLLKRDESNKDVARGALFLFASCLDAIMTRALSGETPQGDEGNFVGTAGAVTLLASVGWHPQANADLVTCALSKASLAEGLAECWRTTNQAHRDRMESAFERVVRTALDPSTAAYVRHRLFSELKEDAQTAG
ncbi:hypothetical protein [Dokdonella sp.]|uniref:hypothetical protein n=1 Tax=Dokdonella sp. TaxID=2291710 RepID=UPI003C515079